MKEYRDKSGNLEWVSPGAVTFTREQVLWLLPLLPDLIKGEYPPEPIDSGYIDVPIGKRGLKCRAAFENPCLIAAELEMRLEKTGVDGKLLLAEVGAGYTMFSDEAWLALKFISGWRRKKNYIVWQKQRRYRKKCETSLL